MTMTRFAWYPVRCCCEPRKVFGFLRLPTGGPTILTVHDRRGEAHQIELKTLSNATCLSEAVAEVTDFAIDRELELAVYSDDRPIEFWRGIPGFMEAVS